MSGRLRSMLPIVVLVLALLAVGYLAGQDGTTGPPFSPDSTGPRGLKALVDVLEEVGADVEVVRGAPPADATAALLVTDTLDEAGRADLLAWVEGGRTLVVADPASPLAPERVGETAIGFVEASLPRGCTLPALADVERITAPGGALLSAADPEAVGCFSRGAGHWLVAEPQGEGTVVALGGPEALTNRRLGEADNALLAVGLLAPDPAGAAVAVVGPARPGEGEADLGDLVPRNVQHAVVQLLIAFAFVVAWRARRLGPPVREPREVRIAGSELVAAVGGLLQQAGGRGEAARLLREDLRRQLTERYGLPADAEPELVATVVADRRGVDAAEIAGALTGPEPDDDAGLVAFAGHVESLRARTLASRPAHPDRRSPSTGEQPPTKEPVP